MSNNPFRMNEISADAFGDPIGSNGGPVLYAAAHDTQFGPSGVSKLTKDGKSMVTAAFEVPNPETKVNGHTSTNNKGPAEQSQWYQHTDPFPPDRLPFYQGRQQNAQAFENGTGIELPGSTVTPPVSASHQYPEVNTRMHLSAQAPEINERSHLSAQAPEVNDRAHLSARAPEVGEQPRSDVVTHSHYAHVPSFSHIENENFPTSRPAYVRAFSSQLPESVAPQVTPGEAHAEALRRIGKAGRGPRTIKRRGSNESLSSLISYSIRKPGVSARSESHFSLDTLAVVLEDAAEEGNLPLVEAVMALGANPNFRSVHRLKNRRHDALNKATAAGHVHVMDYLLRQGATFGSDEPPKNDAFRALDYKLLDVAYAGYNQVARYLITMHGANPFVEQWPKQFADANRTVYRRVIRLKVYQRSVLDAIAKMGDPEQDMGLLEVIMNNPAFDPAAIATRVYEDMPYSGDGSRMSQATYHYSPLSIFVKAGWANAVKMMLAKRKDPSAYQLKGKTVDEEGQIPSTNIKCCVYPANALTKDTWLYRRQDALNILRMLIDSGFDITTAQQTADDSAARTPLGRAILANASEGIELILRAKPALVKEDVSFRLLLGSGTEQEYKAQPLAAAIIQGSLESARVILRNGAHPYDPAFSYPNVMQFAAGHGGATATAILQDMVEIAPDLASEAIETAIQKSKSDAVYVLLYSPNARNMSSLRLYDMVLQCKGATKDDETQRRHLQIIDLIVGSDTTYRLPRPDRSSVQSAMEYDNFAGMEKLLSLKIITSTVLNEKAYRHEGLGMGGIYTALEWCLAAAKGSHWISLLRSYGAH
jgi:hypothetical protein